ncbi:putative pre-rrna processing protein tsr1 [Phaeomoniella chlamydospora]|uniref:Putative pre-rrna processing protein tsr1 n=1 Tax=Phaeomoniella chlamydospora TaxID=158046 RepID=A0A0G2GJ78_PHACM|nr:putative pre-rrna processing protein tsr1 [Phaeomoniella chlamydospora]
MAPISEVTHHHRSTTKHNHKAFKPRFTSKGALKDLAKGKVEKLERGKRRTPHQQVMSKLARRNHAKQLRLHHHEKKRNEDMIFQGRSGVAKNIAVVPLSSEVNVAAAIKSLNNSVDVDEPASSESAAKVLIERFRRNLLYIPAKRDLLNALDVCRLADWVILVLAADQDLDEVDDLLLRSIEGQGITNVVAVVQGLEHITPSNKRSKLVASTKGMMNRYFPSLEKVYSLENEGDTANLVRSLCTAATKGIRWRDERSWMVIEGIQWPASNLEDGKESVILKGVVRGRGLNPDRLVHLPGWGDYQIGRIMEIPKEGKRKNGDDLAMDVVNVEYLPTEDQDSLDTLAPEEVAMTDATSTVAIEGQKGVLLDDHHYFSDEDEQEPQIPRRLPRGTSKYQAAWYLEDISDSGSDITDYDEMEDENIPDLVKGRPEDGMTINDTPMDAMTEAGPTEYADSEMHVDASPEQEAAELEAYRASRKKEAEADLEFPDEIELHPNISARERLAKYRGLKSLRTSEWNTEADAPYEPEEHRRLLQIPDYKKSKAQATRESLVGGIAAGTRVEVEVLRVPSEFKASSSPTCMFALLRHEHKHTVININLTLNSDVEAPLKSKEELIIQIGSRRFVVHPVFSAAGNTPNDVHKSDRYLHPGRSTIASFTGPLTWGAVPILVFRRSFSGSNPLNLIGTATTLPSSASRIIAKRVILTGHPYKIHKKLVTVRYMFFNDEDVAWFKAMPLWTKRGRQGYIKESLGTHGYFKATFDGKINPMDAVGISLYKRVWPRPATAWNGNL